MVAMAAMEKAPLAMPKKITLAFSGHTKSIVAKAEDDKPTVATAENKQPPTIQACTEPNRPPIHRELAPATDNMPMSTPM